MQFSLIIYWVDEEVEDKSNITEEKLQELLDWSKNPLAALPQWISFVSSNS